MRYQNSPEVKLRTLPLGHPGLAYGPESIRYNKDGWRELDVEGSGPNGPKVAPGEYTVIIEVNKKQYRQKLEVLKDPKSTATNEDIREQVALAIKIRDKATELINMGNNIEWIRKQIDDLREYLSANGAGKDVIEACKRLDQKFIDIEQKLFVLRTTGASENGLRFPQQLFSHLKMLGYYVMTGDARPTKSKYDLFKELSERLKQYQRDYKLLVDIDLKEFNQMLTEKGIFTINAMK